MFGILLFSLLYAYIALYYWYIGEVVLFPILYDHDIEQDFEDYNNMLLEKYCDTTTTLVDTSINLPEESYDVGDSIDLPEDGEIFSDSEDGKIFSDSEDCKIFSDSEHEEFVPFSRPHSRKSLHYATLRPYRNPNFK